MKRPFHAPSYEADVVKPVMRFFLISWWVALVLRSAAGARYERTAAKRKTSLPLVRSEAWSSQKRNHWKEPTKWEGPRLCRLLA